MGKEYITDTVSLRGVQSTDRDGYQTKLSQVTANVALTEGEEQNLPVFSVATTGPPPKEESKDTATTISIGGLVDESSPIQPIFLQTANTIRFYTGEVPDPRAVAYYPGAERLTINSAGRVGINSPETYATLDVREALPSEGFGPGRPRTSSIAITQPFYKSKKGDTTPEFGNIFFRANTSEEEDNPVVYSRISSGNNFQVRNSYEDQRANLEFYTNTGDEERTVEKKHLEINGFEGKTKIFTQLNLSNVPVFRDLKAAMAAGLVNGDVWTDTEGNLKIILGEQDEELL
tara:strand:- start:16 stop:882 length:867 start_codon:yes stop_codon:yes gene_type:complete